MTEEVLRSLCDQYGTPTYVFDTKAVQDYAKEVKSLLGPSIGLCYSIKANPFLVPAMCEATDLLEVCSPGELSICEKRQVPREKILYSGVNKMPADIKEAFSYGVGTFTAESIHQAKLLNEEALRQGKVLPLLLRLNTGSQFGMSREDLLYLVDHRSDYPGLSIEGVHLFGGTQRKKLAHQREELAMLKELFLETKEKHGFVLRRLEYGPGLPVPYFTGDPLFSDPLAPLKELLPSLLDASQWSSLTVEMGRFLAASCGYYMTRVMDSKVVGDANFAFVDGGIHHVNYYGQMMGMKVPRIVHLKESRESCGTGSLTWTVCGSLCTTGDVLLRSAKFTDLALGDVLVFCDVGAYSVTEAMGLFLSRTLPRVVLYDGTKGKLARDFVETSTLNTEM